MSPLLAGRWHCIRWKRETSCPAMASSPAEEEGRVKNDFEQQ
jgi:hypothetical protein